jgi:DNA/RNA endonuclease YhcR with UshA esterase domain
MRRALAVFAFGLLASLALAEDRKTIFDSDAAKHVGETVSVRGLVAGVYTSKSNTFINFGAAYPHHTFTAVIFSSASSRFKDPQKWDGYVITVTGKIKLYKGKPEIVLESPSQVSE